MANVVDIFSPRSISRQVSCVLLFISLAHTQNTVGKTSIYYFIQFYIKIANVTEAKLASKN